MFLHLKPWSISLLEKQQTLQVPTNQNSVGFAVCRANIL